MDKCSNCGLTLSDNFKFCPECGNKIIDNKLKNDEYELGNTFFKQKEYKEAIKHYTMAMEEGNAEAINMLGYCNQYNYGMDGNSSKMLEYYELASNKGSIRAKYNLGLCHFFGNHVKPNKTIGLSYITEAAEAGVADAQCFLAHCYKNGVKVDKDLTIANKWYEEANKNGNKAAYINLKNKYTTKNYSDLELKEMAKDDSNAQTLLGERYENNKCNYKSAYKWYSKAVESDNPVAMYNLGMMYHDNKIKDKDGNVLKNTTYLYRKLIMRSAEQGYSPAIDMTYRYYVSFNICCRHVDKFLKEFAECSKEDKEAFFAKYPVDENDIERDEDIDK